MDVIFFWLIGGVAALLLLAAAVAGWEQLRRNVRPQDEFASATPRAVNVDVRLDRLTGQPAAAMPAGALTAGADPRGDIVQRRAALDDVLARLAQPPGAGAANNPAHWADTTPMVAPGQLDSQDDAAAARQAPEFSASQQP